jgi:hypothetical protein
MRTRKIVADDYRVAATHGYDAAEVVKAIGEFGSNVWQAADELLSKIESKDRYDGQRFADLVFDQLVGLVYDLNDECGVYDWEDRKDCDKEMRSRVYGKEAPAGVVERTLWLLTDQLQQCQDNKISPRAISTINALSAFGLVALHNGCECLDGQEGVDAEIFWRKVARAALELAECFYVYTGDSGEDWSAKSRQAVEQVAEAINSADDAVGVIEFALQSVDELLTSADARMQGRSGADELPSPI